MEVKRITPQQKQNSQQFRQAKKQSMQSATPAFTGAAAAMFAIPSVFLRFLDTNQAWGANLVDIGSMVVPRTYYDTTHRGWATGMETGRRESTGTFNHAMVGMYGFIGGALLAMGLNKAYDFKAHKIFANNETLNILGDNWYNAVKSGAENPLDTYLDNVLKNIKFYNPERADAVDDMVSLSEETKNVVKEKLANLIVNGERDTIKSKDVDYIKALMTADTGAEKNVVLHGSYKGKAAQADNTLSTLIENIHNLTKAFRKEKVVNSFKEAVSSDSVKVLKSLKSLNVGRSVAGLGFASLFGMSVQPINMYYTKKNTGCDGFPGVPGRKRDRSAGFVALKTAMAGLFGLGAISTIMMGGKKSVAKESLSAAEKLKAFGSKFLTRIQFKGKMPTINQLKFVYGMTIMSRLMCARDENELRESTVKDTLGFLNLLILGSLVTKGVTRLMNKDLIAVGKESGKGFMNWMKNSSVKSRDEVLLETLKKHNIAVTKDGKALSYGKLLEAAKGLPKEAKSVLNRKLWVLNIAQLIGYAYSGIFLGYYLPKINDKMSKANEEKRIAKVAKAEGKTVEQVKAEMAEEIKRMEAAATGKPQETSALTVSSTNNDVKNFKNKHIAA